MSFVLGLCTEFRKTKRIPSTVIGHPIHLILIHTAPNKTFVEGLPFYRQIDMVLSDPFHTSRPILMHLSWDKSLENQVQAFT